MDGIEWGYDGGTGMNIDRKKIKHDGRTGIFWGCHQDAFGFHH